MPFVSVDIGLSGTVQSPLVAKSEIFQCCERNIKSITSESKTNFSDILSTVFPGIKISSRNANCSRERSHFVFKFFIVWIFQKSQQKMCPVKRGRKDFAPQRYLTGQSRLRLAERRSLF